MIFKNTSKSKLTLAFISIVITFFVWQQGLRDSLNRPSVSFDISQKEQEIAELSVQSIPVNLKKFFIINDPVDQINKSLSEVSFKELSERNKLIRVISLESNDPIIYKNISKDFENKNFKFLIDEIEKKSNNNSYKPNSNKFDLFKSDRFLYHLLSRKFDFDDSALITKSFSRKMFFKILAIRLIPLLTILIGSILALKILWKTISINSKSKDLISCQPNFFKDMVVHNIFRASIEPISIDKSGISLIANIFKNILLENDFVINELSSKSNFLLKR